MKIKFEGIHMDMEGPLNKPVRYFKIQILNKPNYLDVVSSF